MTSYERVMTALDHKRPDRPPLNYFGTAETTQKLLKHLRLDTHEELLCYFGADLRYVDAEYIGPEKFNGASGFHASGRDMWGVDWIAVHNDFCTYYELAHSPLAGAQTLAEVENYDWPSSDWLSVAHLKDEISRINKTQRRAIQLGTGPFFETAWSLRGFELFLMDMIERPDIAQFILKKVTTLFQEVALRAIEAADGGIDILGTGSDLGMQTGMMFSPKIWREQIKPWHEMLLVPFKQMGLKTRYHTDGAVVPVIEDMIEMGLDLLDPIQPKATGMQAENLKTLFEGRLSFYGGVDTQELLPMGTAREVEQDVLRLISVLGSNGGYVAAASNAVQPDVPLENILALYGTAREYKY